MALISACSKDLGVISMGVVNDKACHMSHVGTEANVCRLCVFVMLHMSSAVYDHIH